MGVRGEREENREERGERREEKNKKGEKKKRGGREEKLENPRPPVESDIGHFFIHIRYNIHAQHPTATCCWQHCVFGVFVCLET